MRPFLLTHKVAGKDFLFDISSKLYPLSIRDQMIRGLLIIEEALEEKLISPHKPLLVVGAGAAGATAALTAAQRGVPTTLLEQSEEPFTRQLGCDTRVVSPTIYDWPAEHHERLNFPWTGVKFPLSWYEEYAGPVASAWRAKLKRHARSRENPKIKFNWTLEAPETLVTKSPSSTGGLLEVDFVRPPGPGGASAPVERDAEGPHGFAMILSCIGLGRERSSAGEHGYRGLDFWEPDQLTSADYGARWSSLPKILISGGGDGALQDFLRVVTIHDNPREILAVLPDDVKGALAAGIRTAEEQALRAYVWNTTRYDCRSQYKLHRAHLAVVRGVLSRNYDSIKESLDPIIRAVPRRVAFVLAHPCYHFSACYALNRALVLLISEYVKKEHGVEFLKPFRKIIDVEGVDGHDCRTQTEHCRQTPHNVKLGVARCENMYDKQGGEQFPEPPSPYDVVVVRHGIEFPPYLFGVAPDSHSRHILPYYIDADWYKE